jgi:hypothetical protein
VLEVDEWEPIAGSVRVGGGAPTPFTGWLELMSMLNAERGHGGLSPPVGETPELTDPEAEA